MLIVDGKRYKQWTPKDEEKEFHPLVKAQSKEIFGKDTIYFDVKTTLKSASGFGSIPDAYVLKIGEPSEWYVIENELATHPAYEHIGNQLHKFINGIDNKASRNQILDLLYDVISKNSALKAEILSKTKSDELHRYLSNLLAKTPRIVVIIDEKTPQVEDACQGLKYIPYIIEFKTFEQENNSGVYAHLFEPLHSENFVMEQAKDRQNTEKLAKSNGNIEDLIVNLNPQPKDEIKALYKMLIQEIEKLSNNFTKEVTETRVIFKEAEAFVGVEPKKTGIKLHLYFKGLPNKNHVHRMVKTIGDAKAVIDECREGYRYQSN